MDLKLTLDARQTAGLAAQVAAYNAGNPPETQHTAESFCAALLMPQIDAMADKYDPATTGDVAILRAAIKADPVAVQDAIEAKEAEAVVELQPIKG